MKKRQENKNKWQEDKPFVLGLGCFIHIAIWFVYGGDENKDKWDGNSRKIILFQSISSIIICITYKKQYTSCSDNKSRNGRTLLVRDEKGGICFITHCYAKFEYEYNMMESCKWLKNPFAKMKSEMQDR